MEIYRTKVIGRYIPKKITNIRDIDINVIEIGVGDRVKFIDNSYIADCNLNKRVLYAGCEDAIGMGGVVIETSTTASAMNSGVNSATIEMPIKILADNGDFVYVNPLNIQRA